jgi:hypothetical protein
VFYRIGEHIIFEDKKFSIFSISIQGKNLNEEKATKLKALAKINNFYVDIKKDITLNIPMITS